MDNTLQLNSPASSESGDMEIDLLELIGSWKRHLSVILLVGLITAFLGYAYTFFFVTPKYRATATMYVVSASTNAVLDISDLNLGTSLTTDYTALVQSRTLMERVLQQTGDTMSTGSLSNMLTVKKTGSRILEFTVTSSSPQQAMRLANGFVDQALTFLPEVMGIKDNPPHIIDRAILPTAPFNMSYMKNMVIFLLAGVLLALAFYTVRFLMTDTFDSSEDVEKYLGVSPLAVIPENNQHHRGGNYYYYTDKGKRKKKA